MKQARGALTLSRGLRDAVAKRRLLPFIGAGFSKNINPLFPDWSAIVDRAAVALRCNADILRTQGDLFQIAEYVDAKGRLPQLYQALSAELNSPRFSVGRSRAHQLLPYLDARWIFTTNWDSWIERSFQHQGIECAKIVTVDDFVVPRRIRPSRAVHPLYSPSITARLRRQYPRTTIVKYHGDFSRPASIVFGASAYYDRLDFEHPLDIRLRSEIIGRSALFIGYSFNDPNVRYIWHKLAKLMKGSAPRATPKSYFVTHSTNPLAAALFARLNVEIVPLSPVDVKGDLERFLDRLIQIQRK